MFNEVDDDTLVIKHIFNNLSISTCFFNGCFKCNINPCFGGIYKEICSNWDYSDNIKTSGNKFILQNFKDVPFKSVHIRLPDRFGKQMLSEHTKGSYDEQKLLQMISSINDDDIDTPLFIASNNIPYLKNIGLNFVHGDINDRYCAYLDQYVCSQSETFYYLNLETSRFGAEHNRSTFTSFIIDHRLYKLEKQPNTNVNLSIVDFGSSSKDFGLENTLDR